MTSLAGQFQEDSFYKKHYSISRRHPCRHALKSKENIYKHKCSKYLKRKFKKYRLRRDGKEDEDVINVSQILIKSLKIKSPSKNNCSHTDLENLRPRNYLFKMVRRRQNVFIEDDSNSSIEIDIKDKETVESPNNPEKKATNAFKLLMDSRNKSIGGNSPGKDKPVDEAEVQQMIEKKNAKVKRNLMLQKMAEVKGSLKKKEIEEQQDKLIKKKMEKRAEKLKNMIFNKEPKTAKVEENTIKSKNKSRNPLNSIDTQKNDKIIEPNPKKTLQIVDIFNESIDMKVSPERKKQIPKEDAEFLNKLSPSIRKTESMLSYFKKVDKDDEKPTVDSLSPNIDNENDNSVIKVKFMSAKKKGKKKRKNIVQNGVDHDDNSQDPQIIIPSTEEVTVNKTKERRKRKREIKDTLNTETNIVNNNLNDDRPKRNSKKPIKYSEDVCITSSDEELHIFTPKKKKQAEKKIVLVDIIDVDDDSEKDQPTAQVVKLKNNKISKKENKKEVITSKKLAPIFTKTQSDPAAVEAKQKFLQSGVPDQLKKIIAKQKNTNIASNNFVKVVHVQQLESNDVSGQSITAKLYEEEKESDFSDLTELKEDIFTKILNLSPSLTTTYPITDNNSVQVTLQHLKDSYPRFPVYRTYRLLRSKKKGEFKDNINYVDLHNSVEIVNCSIDEQNDNPDQLNWCDKYKPTTSSQIIGNFESIKELKKWLVSWTENQIKSKCNKAESSDSSDFCYSDTDSKENVRSNNNNLLIVSGPIGCGKTSSVYAVAAELSIKVIEVNASSKRTGKIMLQDLQEATQSHKVNRGTTSSENSQSSQKLLEPAPVPKVKKRGRPKKVEEKESKQKIIAKEKSENNNLLTASQESSRTGMSLILIDDADIVFDQDDGFCSAITQLVYSSKRPVILITSSLSCPHLQKFIQTSKILSMNSLLPSMLGMWLDIMCLADSGACSPGTGAKFLDYFKGDIRKTINCLQFYIGSQNQQLSLDGEACSQNIDNVKISTEDENSNMSWIDQGIDEKQFDKSSFLHSDYVWKNFKNSQLHWQTLKHPLELFNVWWSIPKLLLLKNTKEKEHLEKQKDLDNDNNNKLYDKTTLQSLDYVLETLSACDVLSLKEFKTRHCVSSNPWYATESDSVSEIDSLIKYDKKYEINNEISHDLLTRTFRIAQDRLGIENEYDLDIPGTSVHREKERITSRHNNLNSFFNGQAVLDRRALALDYWPSCRAICRAEKTKTDSNFKRNNRFCHYLKSLGIHCKNDSYDKLADSLCNSGTKN